MLDTFEQIAKPELLSFAVEADTLLRFRNAFAAGKKSRFGTRSPHTVASKMATLMAAFHWARQMGMIAGVGEITRFRAGKKKKEMRGRPISGEEFERLLAKVPNVTGDPAAETWRHLLRGLWESGLRLGEALEFSWDLPRTIRPVWRRCGLPTIKIPGAMHKNGDDEEIPMLPARELLLSSVPREVRTGWIFEPLSIEYRAGRNTSDARLTPEHLSKIMERIGEAAGVIMEPAKGKPPEPKNLAGGEKPNQPARTKSYTPPKFASAHDLRRSVATDYWLPASTQ